MASDKPVTVNPVAHILQFFQCDHLPPDLRKVAKPFAELAIDVAWQSNNPETTVCLRKLLEAKDAAVRAAISEAKAQAQKERE